MPAFPDDRSAEISAALGVLPSGTPVSEVARRLMELFTSGSIQAGTRLPPERHLASSLGVGRSAVREALETISHMSPWEAPRFRRIVQDVAACVATVSLANGEPRSR